MEHEKAVVPEAAQRHYDGSVGDMDEIAAWVDRVAAIDGIATGTLPIQTRMYRVATPSPIDFDGTLVRVKDTGAEIPSLGNYPSRLSILFWPDAGAETDPMRDQKIATQLGALLTFATNRKVRVASAEVTTRMEGSDVVNFMPSGIEDREIGGVLPSDLAARFERNLSYYVGLGEGDRAVIGQAIELHYAAVHLFETDLESAHTLTVAGVETLATAFENSAPTWERFEDADRFDDLFLSLDLEVDARRRLREAILLGKHLRLRQGFASYVCRRLPPEFWDQSVQGYTPELAMTPDGSATFTGMAESEQTPMENLVPRDREVLRRRLLATYDARSSYVHAGRRSQDPKTTLSALSGHASTQRKSLVFAGMRRILLELIRVEMDERSNRRSLPDLQLIHPPTT